MRLKRIRQYSVLVATIIGAGLSGPAFGQISGDIVKIGVMSDQSGAYAANGGPGQVVAAKMAVEDFGGKILGKPIQVVVGDDQNNPDTGVNIARRWLDVDGVDTIITNSVSSLTLNVAQLMAAANKPYMLTGPQSELTTTSECTPMNIQWLMNTYSQSKAGVAGLKVANVKKVFLIVVDYAFGKSLEKYARTFLKEAGIGVAGAVTHPLGETDFASYFLRAMNSDADAILLLNGGSDMVNAIKQAQEFKIEQRGKRLAVLSATINVIESVGASKADGLGFSTPFYWDQDERTRDWSERFMALNKGVPPTMMMSATYSAVTHYLKSIKAVGTDDGKAVMANMRATPINDPFLHNVRIREDGQVLRDMYSVQIKVPTKEESPHAIYEILHTFTPDTIYIPLQENDCKILDAS